MRLKGDIIIMSSLEKQKSSRLKEILIVAYLCFAILSFVIILIIPFTREEFSKLSLKQPYLMGFIKFALLATAGELIAAYIVNGEATVPVKVVWKFIIWGFIGVWITFMMGVYKTAVAGMGLGGESKFLSAFFISLIMNTTFGPTFMAIHKCTDKFLELRAKKEKANLTEVVKNIDWSNFFSFTLLKTVPLFWIPAHTITFLLPAQYQVMMAAGLSVALGVILSFGNRRKASKEK